MISGSEDRHVYSKRTLFVLQSLAQSDLPLRVRLVWDSGIARNSYGEFDVIKKRSEGTGFESFSSTSSSPSVLLLRHVTHIYLVVFSASSYSNSSTLRTCNHSISPRFSRRSDLFQRRTLPSLVSFPVY